MIKKEDFEEARMNILKVEEANSTSSALLVAYLEIERLKDLVK